MMPPGRLLAGCAVGAMLATAPAAAQSYLGGGSVVAGDAAIIHTPDGGPGFPATTQILVLQPETVIEWRPVDALSSGAIDFQPAGTNATFQADPALADYTVLNRILPIDATDLPIASTVAFRGTTTALLVNNPGGHIWFYSATGIIAGPTATFNVGSLILTTNNIAFVPGDPSGSPPTLGSIYGPGGLVQFTGPAGSTGLVDVQPGALIDATGANAYVALVAPRVFQRGIVQADGQIAYLAAEQVDMTINGGLFDFAITVGTEDSQGLFHSGTTTGPASTGLADAQRISMVALPKNEALTMLLSGSIGYSPAASAFDDGSAIVLAAGFATDDPTALPGNNLGNIEIGNATFGNPLTAYASDTVALAPVAGTTAFQADATLYAANTIDVTAEAGEGVTATNLRLHAGTPGAGGAITLQALGSGLIQVANNLIADASSAASLYVTAPFVYNASGGAVSLIADGGTISAAFAEANTEGRGGFGDGLGGIGQGGAIDLRVLNNGTLALDAVSLLAGGDGGPSALQGGNGLGGSVDVADLGGQLDFGSVLIDVHGNGGTGDAVGGAGNGGTVNIAIASQAQSWDSLLVSAGASAGLRGVPTGQTGLAAASLDAVDLTVTGPGSLAVTGDAVLEADSFMGHDNAAGLEGQAGVIEVLVAGGGTLAVGGTLSAHANALFNGDAEVANPDTTPVQRGGNVSLVAQGGTVTAANLEVAADAVGASASASAGSATGGTALVTATDGGTIQVSNGLGTSLANIHADGLGAPGPFAAHAIGGTARLVAADGTIEILGDTVVSASGLTGPIPAVPALGGGFNATGGVAAVELQAGLLGTGRISVGGLAVRANGDARLQIADVPPVPGGQPVQGAGGDGAGGNASLLIGAGTFTAGPVSLEAIGIGGASATAATGGEGSGGAALFQLDDPTPPIGPHTIASLAIDTSGRGGPGTSGAAASDVGTLRVATSAPLTVGGDITLTSLGTRTPAGAGIDVSVSGPSLTAGGNIALSTSSSLVVSGLVANGTLSVVGTNGVTAGRLASGGTTLLRADNGAVLVSTDLASAGPVTALGRSLDLTSLGSLTFAALDATAGGATVRTGGNLTATNLTASAALDLDIGGAFNLSGTARGTAISVRSSDIALGAGARIGTRGVTQTVSLINRNSASVTVVGDGVATPGYRLGAGEAASLFADQSIRITGAGDIAIGDLALGFGTAGNIGSGGLLEISTPARVSITGDVALTTSSAADTFLIDPSLIELDTLQGSIALRNAGGAPLGRLAMVGGTIAVATGPVLGQLAGATDLTAINALLNQPGGTPQPLLAGAIELTAAQGLYIQNTGATGLYRDRRGFEASALAIQTGSPTTRIAINGLVLTAGGPVTGLDTQRLVTINGIPAAAGGSFDPASTINGCGIGAACAPPAGSNPPSSEDLDTPLEPGEPAATFFVGPLIELAQTDPLIEPPLVDEPITGVGNDDLWQPRCSEENDEDGTCPEEANAR